MEITKIQQYMSKNGRGIFWASYPGAEDWADAVKDVFGGCGDGHGGLSERGGEALPD